jgi:hypothetical protein
MIGIVIVLSLVAAVIATVLALAASHVEVSTAGVRGTLFFVSPSMPPRPRGVQEEDLPRFAFRDRVASPATATATAPVFGSATPVPC